MINQNKKFIISLSIVLIIFIVIGFYRPSVSHFTLDEPDFYGISEEITLEEFLNYTSRNNIPIHLPIKLPTENLKMTAIYLKKSPFITIIVYSEEGNKDYKTAEFGIEIIRVNPDRVPTFSDLQAKAEKSPDVVAKLINNWPVIIYEHAYNGHPEFREKYGDYNLIAFVYIGQLRYLIGAPLVDNANDLIPTIESMSLAN